MLNTFIKPRFSIIVRLLAAVWLTSLVLAVYLFFQRVDEEMVSEIVSVPSLTIELPDFESITDVDVKKQTFFTFLHAYVERQNERVLATRAQLLHLEGILNSSGGLSNKEREELMEVAKYYRLGDSGLEFQDLLEELLLRADIIPDSIALAQAATESAWGTSRFAKEGNNIFGQWCFDEGCGLVPGRRAEDASHEVRSFASVDASVRSYIRNINTNPAYEYFRELRAQMRYMNVDLDAHALTEGLKRYSERGNVYLAEVRDIIRINDLIKLYERS